MSGSTEMDWQDWEREGTLCLARAVIMNGGAVPAPVCVVCGSTETIYRAMHWLVNDHLTGTEGIVVAFHCRDCDPSTAKCAVAARVPQQLRDPRLSGKTGPEWDFVQGNP